MPAGAIDDSKPDEIGVIELVAGLRLGQPFARHVELDVRQQLGGVAAVYADELRDEMILGWPQRLDLEDAAVVGFERAVAGDRFADRR